MATIILLLPVLSGVFDGLLRVIVTFRGRYTHQLLWVAGGYLFALPYYAVWLLMEGVPDVRPDFWLFAGLEVPLLTAARICEVRGYQRAPLTLAAPLSSVTSALLLITSPLMGGGRPTWWGGMGVMVLTVGLYWSNTREQHARWMDPFLELFHQRGLLLILAAVSIFAVTANLDYRAWQSSNTPFFLLIVHGSCGILSTLLIPCLIPIGWVKREEADPRGAIPILALYGLVLMLSVVCQVVSFAWIPVVPYVVAGKRAGAILFAAGAGIAVSLLPQYKERHKAERENLRYRIPGMLVMIGGMLIVIFFGK